MLSVDGDDYKRIDYDTFSVGDAASNYKLNLGPSISGLHWFVRDSILPSHDMAFSAADQDNDNNPNGNCAANGGGW